MESDYLSISQAARYKGTTRATLYLAIKQGRLPYTVVASLYYVRAADVDTLILQPANVRKTNHQDA